MRIVTQMVEGNASAVGGLEVALLLLQHLETVLAHPLVIHQLRLQQAGCGAPGPVLSEPAGNPRPHMPEEHGFQLRGEPPLARLSRA